MNNEFQREVRRGHVKMTGEAKILTVEIEVAGTDLIINEGEEKILEYVLYTFRSLS